MSARFRLRQLGMRYNGTPVLQEATLDFSQAELVSVAGPNGAGKSTLLTIMAGLRKDYSGECSYQDIEVARWNRKRFARQVSFVPQSLRLEFPFSAEQVVLMGRTPHGDGLFESPEDRDAVEQAMAITDTLAFRGRDFRTLSGGERQRVILASALAQSPRALLLDEPTTFLDLRHQISLYKLLRRLCGQNLLVVAVTHDLNLAAGYSDRVVLLHEGRVAADASPSEVIRSDLLREVFGIDSEVREGPGGRPWILYGC